MQILQLEKKYLDIVEKFLTPYECTCVQLCSLVRKAESQGFIVVKNNFQDVNDIFGLFSFDGSMHHCFPNLGQNLDETAEFESVFVDFIQKSEKKLKCLNGLSNSTNVILDILEKQNISPFQINKYNLLVLNKNPENPPEPLMNGDSIKRCTMNDYDFLFNLQKNYLIDEVAPNGKKVTDLENSVVLKQILKNQICVSLISNEEFVSKANTNANIPNTNLIFFIFSSYIPGTTPT